MMKILMMSPEILFIGTAFLGVGMATIIATEYLWLEKRMVVTARYILLIFDRENYGIPHYPQCLIFRDSTKGEV